VTSQVCDQMGSYASEVLQGQIARVARPIAVPVPVPLARVGNIDLLRIVAAIGVVWFHTMDASSRQIGYAGLPVFLLICFSLITRQSHGHTTAQFLDRRWNRLLKPWLFWSVIYGLCRLAKAVCLADPDSLGQVLSPWAILAGTHAHLWYLPFAFAAGFLVYGINRWSLKSDSTAVALAATVIGVLTLIEYVLSAASHRPVMPLAQWEFGLATIPLGFAIGRSLLAPSRRTRHLLLLAISLMTLSACVILGALGYGSGTIPYGLAVPLVCLAYGCRDRSYLLVASLAPLTLGIYLIHPMVIYGLGHVPGANQHWTIFITLTICISALATAGLMRTPVRKFL